MHCKPGAFCVYSVRVRDWLSVRSLDSRARLQALSTLFRVCALVDRTQFGWVSKSEDKGDGYAGYTLRWCNFTGVTPGVWGQKMISEDDVHNAQLRLFEASSTPLAKFNHHNSCLAFSLNWSYPKSVRHSLIGGWSTRTTRISPESTTKVLIASY